MSDLEQAFDALHPVWCEAWGSVVWPLLKDGQHGIVLHRVARFPNAASALVWNDIRLDDHPFRKIAAELLGHIREADPELLVDCWRLEVDRMRSAKTRVDAAVSDTIGESLVWAAAKWIQRPTQADAAKTMLKDYIEEAIQNESWSNLNDAIETLALEDGLDAPHVASALKRALEQRPNRAMYERIRDGGVHQLREVINGDDANDAAASIPFEGGRDAIESLLREAERFEQLCEEGGRREE